MKTVDGYFPPFRPPPSSGPYYVLHAYPALHRQTQGIDGLLKLDDWLSQGLGRPIDKWIFLLEEGGHQAVNDCCQLPKSEVFVVEAEMQRLRLKECLSRIRFELPGTLVLLSDRCDHPVRLLRHLGWKVFLIYAPTVADGSKLKKYDYCCQLLNGPPDQLDLTDLSWEDFLGSLPLIRSHEEYLKQLFAEFDRPIRRSERSSIRDMQLCQQSVVKVRPIGTPFVEEEIEQKSEKNVEEDEEEQEEGEEVVSVPLQPVERKPTLADVCKAAAYMPNPPPLKKSLPRLMEIKLATTKKKKLKTLKFAPQCPLAWRKDHEARRCTYWHPKKQCEYYPSCHIGAEKCGYGHPFCSAEGPCQCPVNSRDVQQNHRVASLRSKALVE